MKTAKIFKNGQSQAVRLPKEFRFDGDEVYIKRDGEKIILMPKKRSWKDFFATCEKFSPDFIEIMENRDQGKHQQREDWAE